MKGTGHFNRLAIPPMPSFLDKEGVKHSDPDHHGNMKADCPLHPSKSHRSFSAHVTGRFYCFGCGAKGGDAIDFLRLRDGLSFKEAAIALGAWDEAPSPETVRRLEAQVRERDRQRALEEARKTAERRHRIQLCDEVHAAARIQRQMSERLSELRLGAAPTSEAEQETCWTVMALALDDLRAAEASYCVAAGLAHE